MSRFTLRDLPLAARLVLTVFLISVGLGYFSAMVQLHLQHSSRKGEPLPSPADVVEVFAGLKKADPQQKPPVSKLEKLVTAPVDAPWGGNTSMSAAFFHKSDDYKSLLKDDPAAKPKLDQERTGEQTALAGWIRLPEVDRRAAYDVDAVPFPADTPITADYRSEDRKTVKVRTILKDRCARCHMEGQAQSGFPLENYAQVEKYMAVPTAEVLPGGWVRSERQVGIEKLTQSTHAHMLSFSVLFALTGLTFAFTSYSGGIRGFFGPIVLIAQVADISCWWLARIDGVGPYFAQAIIGTGAVVGVGLLVQILGSLFNMYDRAGKLVVFLLLLVGVGGFAVLYTKAIEPALAAEKAKA